MDPTVSRALGLDRCLAEFQMHLLENALALNVDVSKAKDNGFLLCTEKGYRKSC